MEAQEHNLPAEHDIETTVTIPRFDEEAEEAARPVVPLRPLASDAATAGAGHGSAWPQVLMLILAIAAGVLAGATAVYLNTRATVPSAAPRTSTEATVGGAPEPAATQPARGDLSGASAGAPKGSEARGGPSVRDEPEGRDGKEAERRGRDEEKLAKQARKEEERRRHEEEKLAKRERKEAEKRAERGDEEEKRGGRKARLIETITVKRNP